MVDPKEAPRFVGQRSPEILMDWPCDNRDPTVPRKGQPACQWGEVIHLPGSDVEHRSSLCARPHDVCNVRAEKVKICWPPMGRTNWPLTDATDER